MAWLWEFKLAGCDEVASQERQETPWLDDEVVVGLDDEACIGAVGGAPWETRGFFEYKVAVCILKVGLDNVSIEFVFMIYQLFYVAGRYKSGRKFDRKYTHNNKSFKNYNFICHV